MGTLFRSRRHVKSELSEEPVGASRGGFPIPDKIVGVDHAVHNLHWQTCDGLALAPPRPPPEIRRARRFY